MKIRAATQPDNAAIIDLLKKSLGESSIPITEKLWSWKHEQNPFGPSFVLLAEEGRQLVGVRAFMRWKWHWRGKTFSAIRAVDTATHPEHQGKGIFKKLTLQQVDLCKQLGIDFVFNTPNEQSMPGYLKMGWEKQGRMPLKIKIRRPFTLICARLFSPGKLLTSGEELTPEQEWGSHIIQFFKKGLQHPVNLTTVVSADYISWRYVQNPLFRYNYFTDHKNYVLISRIKKHSFSTELRLVDFFLSDDPLIEPGVESHIRKEISAFCKKYSIDFISLSGQQYRNYKKFFGWMGIFPVKASGPIITIKNINLENDFTDYLNVNHWNYSLGDMELF